MKYIVLFFVGSVVVLSGCVTQSDYQTDYQTDPAVANVKPLNEAALKLIIENPPTDSVVTPWVTNLDFTGEDEYELFFDVRYFEDKHRVQDCAANADDALAKIQQTFTERDSPAEDFKITENTGQYYTIEYDVRSSQLQTYLFNCNYIQFTDATLDFNREWTHIATIPEDITKEEAKGYITFLQEMRADYGLLLDQQIGQSEKIIEAAILEAQMTQGDWGDCDTITSHVHHYKLDTTTGEVLYWQESGPSVTSECNDDPFSLE